VDVDADLLAEASVDMVVATDAGALVAETVTVIPRTMHELIARLCLSPTLAHLPSL
jgi:hypothetical protein